MLCKVRLAVNSFRCDLAQLYKMLMYENTATQREQHFSRSFFVIRAVKVQHVERYENRPLMAAKLTYYRSSALEFCRHIAPLVRAVLGSAKSDSLAQLAVQPESAKRWLSWLLGMLSHWTLRKRAMNFSPIVGHITEPPWRACCICRQNDDKNISKRNSSVHYKESPRSTLLLDCELPWT